LRCHGRKHSRENCLQYLMLKISFNTGDKDPISRRALNIKHWHLMCVLYKRKRLHNTSSTKPTTTIRSTQAGNSQYHGILNFSNYPCTQRHSIRNSPFSAPRNSEKSSIPILALTIVTICFSLHKYHSSCCLKTLLFAF
jgi:hypothetical protein